ncbi:MAG: hypothetical protein HY047_05370 [Acidobacteria bacterium]|nr:hypothetical protein [Acidobacteriota bacterium]
MSPTDPERLERERRDADRQYNDALTALNGVIETLNAQPALGRQDFPRLATALIVYLQQITAFIDTKDRQLAGEIAREIHTFAKEPVAELRTKIATLERVTRTTAPSVAGHQSPATSPQPPALSPQPSAVSPQPSALSPLDDAIYLAFEDVEHLEPSYLMRLLDVARQKLTPGAVVVIETINPACWLAFFSSYVRDLTHVRPIHPETLQFLLRAHGFERVSIRYTAPAPDHVRMRPVELSPELQRSTDPTARALVDIMHTLNTNATILNGLLFSYFDYAVIGFRS